MTEPYASHDASEIELGFPPFLAPLLLIFYKGNGQNGVPGQLLLRFVPFLLQQYSLL
jgi:hypothetical protein